MKESPENGPSASAAAAGGAGFFAIAFDFGFDSNPLQKKQKEHFGILF
jgi:hypothetical protein